MKIPMNRNQKVIRVSLALIVVALFLKSIGVSAGKGMIGEVVLWDAIAEYIVPVMVLLLLLYVGWYLTRRQGGAMELSETGITVPEGGKTLRYTWADVPYVRIRSYVSGSDFVLTLRNPDDGTTREITVPYQPKAADYMRQFTTVESEPSPDM